MAAGSGQRYGAAKQFEPLAGARVVDHSLAVAARHSDGVVVVVPPGEPVPDALRADVVVEGGATRSESVRRGLAAVPGDATIVLVHDAARPAASDALCWYDMLAFETSFFSETGLSRPAVRPSSRPVLVSNIDMS